MTATTTDLPPEAIPYLEAVRTRLAVVPVDERDELLDDVSAQLREVQAESPVPLRERLGPPNRYAAELMSSAGYEMPAATSAATASVTTRLRRWWATSDLAQSLRRTIPQVAPGWWVLRPFLIAAGVLAFVGGARLADEPPSQFMALLAGAIGVTTSIRWGRSSRRAPDRVLTIAALVGILVAYNAMQALPRYEFVNSGLDWAEPGLHHDDGTPISNIYAYDVEGNPVTVFLYDQDGRPIDQLADPLEPGRIVDTEYELDSSGQPMLNLFPRRVVGVGPGTNGMTESTVAPPAADIPATTTTSTATPTTTVPPTASPG